MPSKLVAFSCLVGLEVANGISVGSRLPDVDLDYNFPPEPQSIGEFCKAKQLVVVGLPGAFTPT